MQFRDSEVVFGPVGPGENVNNRLTNIGTKHHRNDVIELKPAARKRRI